MTYPPMPEFGRTYLKLIGDGFELWLEPQPPYMDRGTVLVYAYQVSREVGKRPITIDEADLFPRYYFKLENAFEEMELWIEKRKLTILEGWATYEHDREHQMKAMVFKVL